MRIGIFGGTFNPPHLGHVEAADFARQALGLDKIYFIPAGTPPHKELPGGSPNDSHRLKMAGLAASLCGGCALDIEIKREGKSYTADTVARLAEIHPKDALFLIVGGDMLLSFDKWARTDEIAARCALIALPREENQIAALEEKAKSLEESLKIKIFVLEKSPLPASSTELRQGQKARLIPENVGIYIVKNSLYTQEMRLAILREYAAARLSPKRMAHVLGCESMAAALAKEHQIDEYSARAAAIIHDIAKEMTADAQLQLLQSHGIICDYPKEAYDYALHADTGALIARAELGLSEEISHAILVHTTGDANMSTLDKIIYVADKIEETRPFEDVKPLRTEAFLNLDSATATVMQQTMDALKRLGKSFDTRTQEGLEFLKNRQARPKEGKNT